MNDWHSPCAAYLAQLKCSPSTMERTEYWLGVFSDFCLHKLELNGPQQLYPRHLDSFHHHLLWNPGAHGQFYAPNTVYQGMRMVRAFVRWFCQREDLPDPTAGLVLSRPKRREPKHLSRSEVERLLQTPNETPMGLRDRALIWLFYEGLTEEAAQTLGPGHLDLTARKMHLPDTRKRLELSVFLAEELLKYLRQGRPQLAGPETLLFPSRSGDPLGIGQLRNLVRRHGRQAGLGTVTPRILRRSAKKNRRHFQDRHLPFNREVL